MKKELELEKLFRFLARSRPNVCSARRDLPFHNQSDDSREKRISQQRVGEKEKQTRQEKHERDEKTMVTPWDRGSDAPSAAPDSDAESSPRKR